ncbi:phosphatase PAP2 family protein [Streptomyces dangxiongensis]|uniref:Phosphatase PAP2 family protein n=1 Tax=Streptomyces dangxiongensis TaxID=1442032 RepID=A0A3G2JQU2_9ACTN|nr:phosphatase PAP2 family protein [Streptomyces dangxiongensis]AYN42767.1 phosphatase PAP2 family protein [Streptomyces dangxiongensis]
MTLALGGSAVDGSAYIDVVDLAHRSPGWLDSVVSAWSTYGLGAFALLMVIGWWRARRTAAAAAVQALAAPVIVVLAYGVDAALKLVVREERPCRSLHVSTLEACPAPGDWSFPSNHAAIAFAAAVALFSVNRRLGSVAAVAACAMAASRVWVGVHYPHDVAVGAAVGALVALLAVAVLRHPSDTLVRQLTATRLRALLVAS